MFSRKHAGAAARSDFAGVCRASAKLRFAIAILATAAIVPTAPSHAQNLAFVSATGSGTSCTAAQPCATVTAALGTAGQSGRITCLNGTADDNSGAGFTALVDIEINCPLGVMGSLTVGPSADFSTVIMRHVGFPLIIFQASGTLVLEDCASHGTGSTVLDIEPNGPLTLVVRNSRISYGASGILLKPAAGGSIKATLDHVIITGNRGGGIKADSTNGVINLDVSNSEISDNTGNGINAVAGANQDIVNIKTSVIAHNGAAGVQVNGANAGMLLESTLLDQNGAGATSVVNGGNMFTYGNNSIVGSAGSGFNHTAGLQ